MTSVLLMALPSTPMDGCLSASTSVYAGTSRGGLSWPTSHDPSSVWTFSPISAFWWTAKTTGFWKESRRRLYQRRPPASHQPPTQLFKSLAKMCGIQLSWATAHHPAANGLLECFHRTIKVAIMCHVDQHWTEELPLVFLGICTAFKEDLQASVAELVYGEPLRIPGELLTPSTNPVDPALLITELRQHMARLRPVPAARHASPATFVHSTLEECTHVFLHQDTMRCALEPPYSGPYQVLSRKKDAATPRVRESCYRINRQIQANLHPERYE
jgi:hypothetical protein